MARHSLAAILALLLPMGLGLPTARAQELDVFVVYASSERAQKTELLQTLPRGLSVKAYNVDLLALADYSGKQKVIAKMERASVVVILWDAPLEYLQGRLAGTDVVIVNSVRTGVSSERTTIYVLPRGTDIGALGRGLQTLNAAGEEDLTDAAAIRSADVVFFNEAILGMRRAVSLIAVALLGLQPPGSEIRGVARR